MIDLNLIHAFLEVSKAGSMSLAAQELKITESAVSQRIAALEGQIGEILFLRKRSGVALNKFGRELLEIAQNIDVDIHKIKNWIKVKKDYIGGEVSITTITSLTTQVFPFFLKRFFKKHNEVNVILKHGITVDIEEDVMSGASDIGIIVGKPQKVILKMKQLMLHNRMLSVCSPDYFLAKKKKITKEDFNKASIIWNSNKRSRTYRRICKEIGITYGRRPRDIQLPNMESCKKYVLNGMGVAFMSKSLIYEELKRKKIVALPGFDLRCDIYMITRNEKYESPTVSIFKKELIKYCQEHDRMLSLQH